MLRMVRWFAPQMRGRTDAHRGLEVEQQLFEDVVVGSVHDRQMKLAVGLLRGKAGLGGPIRLKPLPQHRNVLFGTGVRGGTADSALEPAQRIAAVPQIVKARPQRAAHHVRGRLRPLVKHIGPAAASSPCFQQAPLDEPRQRGPHRHAPRSKRCGQVTFHGQPRAGQILADRDRGDQPIGDLVDPRGRVELLLEQPRRPRCAVVGHVPSPSVVCVMLNPDQWSCDETFTGPC